MSTKSTFNRYMGDPEFQKEFDKEYKELEREVSQEPRLVSYLGVLGGGKDFSANKLVKEGYIKVAFADELREMAWDILGWKPDAGDFDRQYDWFKKLSIGMRPEISISSDRNLKSSYAPPYPFNKELTGRQFLQNLGTEGIRKRDPDFWARITKQKIQKLLDEGKKVVTTDSRFLNEVKVLSELGAQFIFCNYKSDRYDDKNTHESEALAQSLLKRGYKDQDIVEF